MIRALSASACLALAMGLTGGVGAPSAAAAPPPPCGFKISPPEVIQVEGISVVTTTVEPDVCLTPPAGPSQNVACIQMQGGNAGQTCAQSHDAATGVAQVYVPLVPGSTYTATGRGCGSWIGQDIADNCQILGPIDATL